MARQTTSAARRDWFDFTNSKAWANACGDGFDAGGTVNGSTLWPGASASIANSSSVQTVSIPITSILTQADWFGNANRCCGLLVSSNGGTGIAVVANTEHATSGYRPAVNYAYADGTFSGWQAVSYDAPLSVSTTGSLDTSTEFRISAAASGELDRLYLQLPTPAKAIHATTDSLLRLTSTSQFTAATTLRVDQAAPPGELQPAPLAPTDLVFSAVTDTSMTVTVTPAASGPTGYKLYKRIVGAGSWDAPISQAGAVFNLTGLVVNTAYQWYATASNAGGDSPASATETQGTINPATGGGGSLSGASAIISLGKTTLKMAIGQTRSVQVIAKDSGGVAIPGYIPTVEVVVPGSASYVTPDPTDASGSTVLEVTALVSGTIVINVT